MPRGSAHRGIISQRSHGRHNLAWIMQSCLNPLPIHLPRWTGCNAHRISSEFMWTWQTGLNVHSMHVGSIHMNLHKVNVHLIESTSRGGLVVHSSRMVLLFMNYARLCLQWDCLLGCWLDLWHVLYCSSLFCSCSDVGKERVFFMAKKSGTAW